MCNFGLSIFFKVKMKSVTVFTEYIRLNNANKRITFTNLYDNEDKGEKNNFHNKIYNIALMNTKG